MPHIESSVEQGEACTLRTRQCRDHVVEIWTLRMRSCEPIADLIFGIDTRKLDDAIDMLPPLSESGLQRQFIAHLDEAHGLVRGILFDQRSEPQRRRGGKIAKPHVGQE
jgi:hypothetical protein